VSSNLERESDSSPEIDPCQVLLETEELIIDEGSLQGLFAALAARLGEVAPAEFVNFALHDATRNVMQLHILGGKEPTPARIEVPVMDSPAGWTWQTQQPVILPDVQAETRFYSVMNLLNDKGIRSYCTFPLTTTQKRLGALGLGSSKVGTYGESDLHRLRRIAQLVAVAVQNALMREALSRDRERLQTLLEFSKTLVTNRDLEKLFPAISALIRPMIEHDYASVAFYDQSAHSSSLYPLHSPLNEGLLGTTTYLPIKETPAGRALLEGEARIFSREDLMGIPSTFVSQMLEQQIQSLCCIPLVTRGSPRGTLNLASKKDNAFPPQDLDFLKQVAAQIGVALDNVRAYREIAELKDKLAKEKVYLEDEIRSEVNFDEIVGESAALKLVLAQARTVAASDATVLILGETGTGKELIARAIHRMSSRKDKSFIKLNCAAIPTGLLESELFGHEKGAFTGAISQKFGRLELADKGTLFLDEVGDLPPELQPKLLRVLQDQEFERLGSNRTIRVNIRLIAATNRDLLKSVAERQFRSDLYYRLNVFPIHLPALRERPSDIPLLVRHFVQKFARRMNKPIETVPTETMTALVGRGWPGNVRELENVIERSVILSRGSVLAGPLGELRLSSEDPNNDSFLKNVARHHIIRVLRETGGVLAGPHGAAARLGMKRTTLQSRMQTLGIASEEYRN
jgi:formate hydrogenlyase transcriptional activator